MGSELIETLSRDVVFNGRNAEVTWFHPKVGIMPGDPPVAVMCCQSITGSDVFGQIHESVSRDLGKMWTEPVAIASLGRHDLDPGWEEGVCDFVPDWHAGSGKLLGIGHNVFYKDRVLARPQRRRFPVYAVREGNGIWSAPKRLEMDDLNTTAILTSGCAQRVNLADGEMILPVSFTSVGREDRQVRSLRCGFDGETLSILDAGNVMEIGVGRGLLEPTVARVGNVFYMSIRAEDERGYVTRSDDGLHWEPQRAWCWDDGEPLTMSTTQQRWLAHSEGLFLVYTRKADHNVNVMRWRAPLFVAEVDRENLCLIQETEREVFPVIGDGVNGADHVARMGNFMPVNVTAEESWVTVGETLPNDGWKGDTLLGRIVWSRTNENLSWRMG